MQAEERIQKIVKLVAKFRQNTREVTYFNDKIISNCSDP